MSSPLSGKRKHVPGKQTRTDCKAIADDLPPNQLRDGQALVGWIRPVAPLPGGEMTSLPAELGSVFARYRARASPRAPRSGRLARRLVRLGHIFDRNVWPLRPRFR